MIALARSRGSSPGQRHDCVAFEPVMAGICIAGRGPGRPRARPDRVLCDTAYSTKAIRSHLRKRGIKTTIPERVDQQANRARLGSTGERPPRFDPEAYKQRNTVERCINKHEQFEQWQLVTTNASTSSPEPSTSPQSGSGSTIPSRDPRDTA
jgi:transposase